MEARESETTIVNAWRSYAKSNDRASQEIVEQDVRRFMRETGEIDYNTAMNARHQQIRALGATVMTARPTVSERHYAGVELLRVAEDYRKRKPDLTDKEAFNLALLSNPVLGEQYTGYPIRRDAVEEVAKFLDQENDAQKRELTATERLFKIVDRVAKLPDRTRDWTEVVRAVFQYPDIIEKASRETMDRLIKELIKEERIWVRPFEFDDVKKKLEIRLRAKHYDLAKTVDSPRNVNERALKLILSEAQ